MTAKKKTRKNNAGGARAKQWWNAPMLAALRVTLWAIVLGTFTCALWMGSSTALNAFRSHPAFAVGANDVAFQTPDYLREEPVQRFVQERLAGLLDDTHIFDRALTRKVRAELLQWPWITRVGKVRRLLPNQLRLELVFRQPAAAVRLRDELLPIDRDGYWLPDDLYLAPETLLDGSQPDLVHDGLRRRPPRGAPWEAVALPAGARLAVFLREKGIQKRLDISEINVTHVGAEARGRNIADISLVTAGGATIAWGTTDAYDDIDALADTRRVDEPDDRRKLQVLEEFLNAYPRLEGVRSLDLRFETFTYSLQ